MAALERTEETFQTVAGEFFRTGLHPDNDGTTRGKADVATAGTVLGRMEKLKDDFQAKFAHCPVKVPAMLSHMPIPPQAPQVQGAPNRPIDVTPLPDMLRGRH